MKIAIMQPYFAPYLGYFQLINEVDLFVFYDDVNFIKQGWINRNNITVGSEIKRFTIPLKKCSQNKKINDVEVAWESRDMDKLIKTFRQNFKDKPIALDVVEDIWNRKPKSISDMAIQSIKSICEHLKIYTKFEKSSEINYRNTGDKLLNLVNICKNKGIHTYVNSEGGVDLYSKKDFKHNGISLEFLKGTPSASLLDILDFKDTKHKLFNYETF